MKVDRISKGKDYITKRAVDNSSVNLIPKESILFAERAGMESRVKKTVKKKVSRGKKQ